MIDINKKIPVAYRMLLGYNEYGDSVYFNSNVYDYDVHPWYAGRCDDISKIEEEYEIKFPYRMKKNESQSIINLFGWFNGHNLQHLFDDTYEIFDNDTLDNHHQNYKSFVYPIIIYDNSIFQKYKTIELPEKVVEFLKLGKVKVVLVQPTEGFMGEDDLEFIWTYNLVKKYNIRKEDFVFLSSNLICKDRYDKLVNNGTIEDSFIVHSYPFFGNTLWFVMGNKMNPIIKKNMLSASCDFIEHNRLCLKKYHFLCFNRVPKWHRVILFGELMSNEKLVNKSITTLGAVSNNDKMFFYHKVKDTIPDNYIHSKKRLLKFFETYDSTIHKTYDYSDLENNKASTLNITAHRESFVNIVTESLYRNNTLFFSEKIYKPIYMCQPFILYGNPYSLKKLKEMGFKTFDKWWDESYDEETDRIRRMEKIVSVLEEISKWSMEKCYEVTNEMEDVLRHNSNLLVSDAAQFETLKLMSNFRNNLIPNKFKKLI